MITCYHQTKTLINFYNILSVEPPVMINYYALFVLTVMFSRKLFIFSKNIFYKTISFFYVW